MANKMTQELWTMLVERNSVSEDTAKYLESKNCLSVENFANWVDSKNEIKDEIHKHIPTMKDNRSDLSNTKMAWREAEAQVSRGVKRSSEGLDNEALDDPLRDEVFKAVKSSFKKFYNWKDCFDCRRIGCDSLHGRFRREFERKQPTMFTLLKAKSLARSQNEGQIKKTKLSNDTELHQKERETYDGPASLSKWFACFDIVVNTWAVTGCFDITYDGQSRKYVHWSEVQEYHFEFTLKSNELTDLRHSEYKIFQYLSSVEEDIRAKAIELARGESECPWGLALTTARKECAHVWLEKRDKLIANNTAPDIRTQRPPKQAAFQPTIQQQEESHCKFFNQGRCTVANCNFAHKCNAALKTGKRCGRKDHGASNHNDHNHGERQAKGKGKGGKDKGRK